MILGQSEDRLSINFSIWDFHIFAWKAFGLQSQAHLFHTVVSGYSPTQRPGEVVHFYFSDVIACYCTRTHLLLRNLMFLTLEDMSVLRNRMSVGGVFVFGWGGWDVSVRCTCTHLDATQCNMMFFAREHIFTASFGAFWQKFQRYSTLELLESICTSMEH